MITVQSVNAHGFVVTTTHYWVGTAMFERNERIRQGHTNVSVSNLPAANEDAP